MNVPIICISIPQMLVLLHIVTWSLFIDSRNALQRIKELQSNEASMKDKMLRLSVETGGCSGFQYVFLLDDKTNSDDRFAFLPTHFLLLFHDCIGIICTQLILCFLYNIIFYYLTFAEFLKGME